MRALSNVYATMPRKSRVATKGKVENAPKRCRSVSSATITKGGDSDNFLMLVLDEFEADWRSWKLSHES